VQTGLIRPSHASADGEGADDDDDQSDLEDFTSCVAPGDSAGAEPAAGRGDPDADGTPDQARSISAALIEDLTTQQTIVAQRVLADDPCLALAALIATLASYAHGGSPMQISESGYREGARPYDRKATFAARFDLCPIASTEALVETLAPLLAAALDLRSYNPAADRRNVGALVGRMDAETYLREMRKVFAAADYFARVPKALCIAALEDMHDGGHFFGLPGRDDLERMKKAELAPWAAEQAQACGWLPEMLRHPAYEIITRPAAGAAQAESTDATTGAAA